MGSKPAVATRMRGVWLGVADLDRSRAFYELLGAHFGGDDASDEIVFGILAGTTLIFEIAPTERQPGSGAYLLFDVTDADNLHAELVRRQCTIERPPANEPWGRQFNVLDPDGYSIAFIGPIR